LAKTRRRRKRGTSDDGGGRRKAKPPFPINLLFNVKAFYVFFIVVMIASLAAVGLGGLGSGQSSAPDIDIDDRTDGAGEDLIVGVASYPDGPGPTIDTSVRHMAILKTDQGDIEIELSVDAPEAVDNFAFLAGEGFYNGTAFFFVNDYFAQAGDPTCVPGGANVCAGVGSPGYTLSVEDSGAGHEQWAVVAPATTSGQDVHGSQFRILLDDDPRLDGRETVFGEVVGGRELLEGLNAYAPCSVARDLETCDADPELSQALVIEEVIVQRA
jgi:cyclophilin family peptidyl-prolyl cis-trans isomerase